MTGTRNCRQSTEIDAAHSNIGFCFLLSCQYRKVIIICLFITGLKERKRRVSKGKVALALMITLPSRNMKATNQSPGTNRHTHILVHTQKPSLD